MRQTAHSSPSHLYDYPSALPAKIPWGFWQSLTISDIIAPDVIPLCPGAIAPRSHATIEALPRSQPMANPLRRLRFLPWKPLIQDALLTTLLVMAIEIVLVW